MDEKIDGFLQEIEDLVHICNLDFLQFDGVMKLKRKLDAEKKFLVSLKSCEKKVQEASLSCLNLIHLKAVVKEIRSAQNVTAIFKNFKDKQNNVLTIDVVYDYGYTWMKVIARSPQALHLKVFCEYNEDIIKQAEQYRATAEFNMCNYKTPKVLFNFTNGITQDLYNKLEKLVFLNGPIVPVDEVLAEKLRIQQENDLSSSEEVEEEIETELGEEVDDGDEKIDLDLDLKKLNLENKPYGNLTKVNLDVSTMLALISDMSNGNYNYEFDKEYLNQQADWERRSNLVPVIEEFLKGKELFMCQTAYDSLVNIVYTVGGKNERIRFEKFKARVRN